MNDQELKSLLRKITAEFTGDFSSELFDYYDAVNKHFFYGKLPAAILLTGITPYGHCDGYTEISLIRPIIVVHPLHYRNLNASELKKERFYIILHEGLHVYLDYILHEGEADYKIINGEMKKRDSHNSIAWQRECNRISKLLGYEDVSFSRMKIGRSKTKTYTNIHGKISGKFERQSFGGSLEYSFSKRFPLSLESVRSLPDYTKWL